MGVYERSAHRKANGAPVFVKQVEGGGEHFLYRLSNGKWCVTDAESEIAKGTCSLRSSRAADLPSESGLGWEYYDGAKWNVDPNLTCTSSKEAAAAFASKAAAEKARLAALWASPPDQVLDGHTGAKRT